MLKLKQTVRIKQGPKPKEVEMKQGAKLEETANTEADAQSAITGAVSTTAVADLRAGFTGHCNRSIVKNLYTICNPSCKSTTPYDPLEISYTCMHF